MNIASIQRQKVPKGIELIRTPSGWHAKVYGPGCPMRVTNNPKQRSFSTRSAALEAAQRVAADIVDG